MLHDRVSTASPHRSKVLAGRLEKSGEERMGQVSIQAAFDSPDTLANATEYLRQYAQDTGSHAAVAVVPKHKIAYPQVRHSGALDENMAKTSN